MLAAYSYWGFHLDKGLLIKLLIGIKIPILVAVIWGTFISPKAAIPVTTTIRIVLQTILFGCSVWHYITLEKLHWLLFLE